MPERNASFSLKHPLNSPHSNPLNEAAAASEQPPNRNSRPRFALGNGSFSLLLSETRFCRWRRRRRCCFCWILAAFSEQPFDSTHFLKVARSRFLSGTAKRLSLSHSRRRFGRMGVEMRRIVYVGDIYHGQTRTQTRNRICSHFSGGGGVGFELGMRLMYDTAAKTPNANTNTLRTVAHRKHTEEQNA